MAQEDNSEYSRAFNNISRGVLCVIRAVERSDEGTCVIYSQGPERLTEISGSKARHYFLTAIQTCIDRSFA